MKAFLFREFQLLFGRPLLYISAVFYLLVLGLFLWFFDGSWNIFSGERASLEKFFLLAPQILILFVSALAVRSFAFEKENKTLGWIFTQPINLETVVFSKFLILFLASVFITLPTLVYVWSINSLKLDVQSLDFNTIGLGYLGLTFCGLTYSAIGIFASALGKTQIQSFLISLLLCFIFYFGWEGIASFNLLGSADYWVKQLGIQANYRNFIKGILDISDILYFLGISGILLWLSSWFLNQTKLNS